MTSHLWLCLFDLTVYDKRVAPALRRYVNSYQPADAVALLRESLTTHTKGAEDVEHWIVALEPDAGNKPSEQTARELSDMLIRLFCFPRDPVQLDEFVPWLSAKSEWFASLMSGGEELAGGSLEFWPGTEGRLVATREQIGQFLKEVRAVTGAPPPDLAEPFGKLTEMLTLANANPSYTLLKASWPS